LFSAFVASCGKDNDAGRQGQVGSVKSADGKGVADDKTNGTPAAGQNGDDGGNSGIDSDTTPDAPVSTFDFISGDILKGKIVKEDFKNIDVGIVVERGGSEVANMLLPLQVDVPYTIGTLDGRPLYVCVFVDIFDASVLNSLSFSFWSNESLFDIRSTTGIFLYGSRIRISKVSASIENSSGVDLAQVS
jgi:hypothetical protein